MVMLESSGATKSVLAAAVPFAVPGVTVWDGFKVGWYKIRMGLRFRFGLEPA